MALYNVLKRDKVVESDDFAVDVISPVFPNGQEHQELDVVVAFRASRPYRIGVSLTIDPASHLIHPDDVSDQTGPINVGPEVDIYSFLAVVEVKRDADLRFTADKVLVSYGRGESSVTEDSFGQVWSFKNFLEALDLKPPTISNVIWLRATQRASIYGSHPNVLSAELSGFEEFVRAVVSTKHPTPYLNRFGRWIVSAESKKYATSIAPVVDRLTVPIADTPLLRERVDRITSQAIRPMKFFDVLGSRNVVLRGRAGTGKTFALLRAAHRLYQRDADVRILVLTYNHALVADIERQLILLGIERGPEGRTIAVRNIHSFMLDLMERAGISGIAADAVKFDERYRKLLETFREYIHGGAFTHADFEKYQYEKPRAYRFDQVLIDEGQDWLPDERDVLYFLFGPERFAVAVGPDQLVRSGEPCDWRVGVPPELVHRQPPLNHVTRLKTNLADFVIAWAWRFEINGWRISAADDADDDPILFEIPFGGRVVVAVGDYLANVEFHEDLIRGLRDAGNYPIDALMCVPNSAEKAIPYQRVVNFISMTSHRMWDGLDRERRQVVPWTVDQLRVVTYESCRGLEGWTTILLDADSHFQSTLDAVRKEKPDLSDDAATRLAAVKFMIPFTRAIDTLVINVRNETSVLGKILQALTRDQDFCRWVSVKSSPRR